jgi:subtilisin-like proprotein convertase family protein
VQIQTESRIKSIMKSKIVVRLALAMCFSLAAVSSKADSSFAGTGVGNIPDDSPALGTYGTPLNVSFNVTNLQSNVSSVSLNLSMYHPALGDLDVRLQAPNGAIFIIFSRVGPYLGGFGNQGMLGIANGTDYANYTFADSGANTLFGYNSSGASISIPSGSYRTSSAGPNDVATSFSANSGFVGLTPAQANGTWTLTFKDADNVNPDVPSSQGSVQSATLVLGQSSSQPPRVTRIGVTNGVVTLTLTGPNSASYRVYATTNLASPQSWSTNSGHAFNASGTDTFTTNTVGPKCFYRVSTP